MTISFFTNCPAPYRIKQIRALSEHLDEEIEIYYTETIGDDRKWQVEDKDHHYLNPTIYLRGYGNLCLDVVDIVKGSRFLIIGGYESPTYLWLSILCRFFKKPYFLLYDGIAPSRVSSVNLGFKSPPKKMIVSHAAGCWVNGSIASSIFETLGGKNVYNQVLVSDLSSEDASALFKTEMSRIILGKRSVIYSGRLISRKNVSELIEAIKQLGDGWILIVAGHGELETQLKLNANEQVVFLGHVEQPELVWLYDNVNVLALVADDEPWGLVVYEALSRNCPVLVGPDIGCAEDLVVDGKNGVKISDSSVESITVGLSSIFELNNDEVDKTNNSILDKWNQDNSMREFLAMMESAGV